MENRFEDSLKRSLNDKIENDFRALNEFVTKCRDLAELERRIGKFNVLRVLRFEYGELRHSNILAWLFDPDESHGLGDSFLRRWLMNVILESEQIEGFPTPIDLDCTEFLSVEVRREWKNIDILIIITTSYNQKWVVCIENKIQSIQRPGQLKDYRVKLESYYPDAQKKVFILLSKNRENPEDDYFVVADYAQIHSVLRDCYSERRDSIGEEPGVLIHNYLEILNEVFMDDSDIADLARRIYRAHKQAIDLIIEHRPDALWDLSRSIHERLFSGQLSKSTIPMALNKGYIRFLPNEWNTEANRQGTAWGRENSAYILFELNLWTKTPRLTVVVGGAPADFARSMWEKSGKSPFKTQRRSKQPSKWNIIHSEESKISVADFDSSEIDNIAERIVDWVAKEYSSDSIQQIRKVVLTELKRLES